MVANAVRIAAITGLALLVCAGPGLADDTPTVIYPPATDEAPAPPTANPAMPGPERATGGAGRTASSDQISPQADRRLPAPPMAYGTLRENAAARQKTVTLKPALNVDGLDDQLRLTGARARRDIVFQVPEPERVESVQFVTQFRNSADVLPDDSRLAIELNGETIAQVRPAALTGPAEVKVEVPPGLLDYGRNTLTFAAWHTHRVACSVASNFDLWSDIDLDATRLALRYADPAPRVTAANLATWLNSGVFKGQAIRFLAPESTSPERATQLSGLIAQGFIARAATKDLRFDTARVTLPKQARPPQTAYGGIAVPQLKPGIYVAVDTRDEVATLVGSPVARDIVGPHVSLNPLGDTADRALLLVSGRTTEEVLIAARQFAGIAGETVSPIPEPSRAKLMPPHSTQTFTDLGRPTQASNGVVLNENLEFRLPAALFPRREHDGVIDLRYRHVGTVGPDARLIIRLNGRILKVEDLQPGNSVQEEQTTLRLPMTSFRPGLNTLGFEALTPVADGEPCPSALGNDGSPPRFEIDGASRLSFNDMSFLYQMPNLHLTGTTGFPYSGERGPVVLEGDLRQESVRSALITLITNLRDRSDASFDLTQPADDRGARDTLAAATIEAVRSDLLNGAPVDRTRLAEILGRQTQRQPQTNSTQSRLEAWVSEQLQAFYDLIGVGPESAPDFPVTFAVLQYEIPGSKGHSRTLVIARSNQALSRAAERLKQRAVWGQLDGAVTFFGSDAREVMSWRARDRYYISRGTVDIGTGMLIVANWLGDRPWILAGLILGLCLVFGYLLYRLLEKTGRGYHAEV
ncbi:cellulose biosynthesis cyclic di-GMP-binding regulatory protein BcsB [Rhodovibrio salinarum]|nr:cellulose biosynthesis cyclic di-GMP-binding regulatory protein BcsB [Rhodovibrio salinarum]